MTAPDRPQALDDCGCCEGVSRETPLELTNRPGLAALEYRSGTHPTFKQSLLAALTTSREPALARLTTREDRDFSIALLDAWATVCDVLTFYQERIANESYLRTATELFSVVELARLIDYRLQPGVAASTGLAFTMEDAPGALGQALGTGAIVQDVPGPPLRLALVPGTKVQSIPSSGEQPATFETIRETEIRAEWNTMRPRLRQPQTLSPSAGGLMLAGTATNLKPGDFVLIVAESGKSAVKRVLNVVPDDQAKITQVDFIGASFQPHAFTRPTLGHATPDLLLEAVPLNDQRLQQDVLSRTWDAQDLEAAVAIQRWDPGQVGATVSRLTDQQPPLPTPGGVFAFRMRAAPFGHNAPRWDSLSANLRFGEIMTDASGKARSVPAAFPADWESLALDYDAASAPGSIALDTVYPAIVKGSWIALVGAAKPPTGPTFQPVPVADNVEVSLSKFAMTAKVSRLTLDLTKPLATPLSSFKLRETSVLIQSEPLSLTQVPIADAVAGNTVVLDRLYLGLKPGQAVAVTGERTDMKGVRQSEVLTVKQVLVEGGFTVLEFEKALRYSYRRDTVKLNGNVAPATHGETVNEVLGSGDGSLAFQSFVLKQPPLTYVSAPNAAGAESTLEVRVNDLRWKEVPTLFGAGPDDRVYVTRIGADGSATVIFGDGITGARLPTGVENVRARYRKGIGSSGNLPANRLTQLLTRPLGLKEATNPTPATGAADAERLPDARRNAPLAVLTLGRIVALRDYEDFARAFAGIAKASATWTWSGTTRGVFVSIAGSDGAEVPEDSALYRNLVAALRSSGDPTVPLRVRSYRPRYFRLTANLGIHPDYLPPKVIDETAQRLRDRFSFAAREFGQPVTRSEVLAAMQDGKGVTFVDLDELYRTDGQASLADVLGAAVPRAGAEEAVGAELLMLDPRPLDLGVLP